MLVSQEQGGTAVPGKGTHISEPGLNCAELSCHPQQLLSLIYHSDLSPGTSPHPRKSRGSSDFNSPHPSPLPKQAVRELQHLQPALNHERQAGKSKAISAGKQRDKATCSSRARWLQQEATAGRGNSVPRAHLGHPSALAGSHLDRSQPLPDGEDTLSGGCCQATGGGISGSPAPL